MSTGFICEILKCLLKNYGHFVSYRRTETAVKKAAIPEIRCGSLSAIHYFTVTIPDSGSDVEASCLCLVDHVVSLCFLGLNVELDFLKIRGSLSKVEFPHILGNLDQLLG